MTMRISEESKTKLESIKRLYNLDSLDEALDYALENPHAIRAKFYQLIGEIMGKYSDTNRHVIFDETAYGYVARLYTTKYSYSISAGRDGKYMGATMGTRTPLPGEDWNRGNDLADGTLSKETIERIKSDIISCELQPIAESQKVTDAVDVAEEQIS